MSEFLLDSEDLGGAAGARLCAALSPLAESDVPLLFEVLLVGEEEIRRLNREQRGVDHVTDVLSFPSMELVRGAPIRAKAHGDCFESAGPDGKGGGRLCLGSVVVCEKRAREQAEEYGHSYERELFYLIVHGVLHCLGYDHETEEERAEMREKEESVMAELGLKREI